LKRIGLDVKLPVLVRCANVGQIFMAENSSSGVRTRQIDTLYYIIREHVKDRLIKVVFVKSCDNDADMFTKLVGKEA
jgi:hypothetical protein